MLRVQDHSSLVIYAIFLNLNITMTYTLTSLLFSSRPWRLGAFAPIAVMMLLSGTPAEASRLALLIGNDNYASVAKLKNAAADADAMAGGLRRAGYEATVVKNRDLKQLKDDLREFRLRIKAGDEVVVFFSGHGVQLGTMNYLLPVDVRSDSEDQVRDDALALSALLEDLRSQSPALTVAIIDACRDNPFASRGRAIGGRGLAGVAGASGQMVIYAAGEGQQALDRLGQRDPVRNGLFTRVFVKEMDRPGITVDQVARNARHEVHRLALQQQHQQVPAIYDQVIGQFYFHAPTARAPGLRETTGIELAFWNSIRASDDVDELQLYLDKYPEGEFADLAKSRIDTLRRQPARLTAAQAGALADANHGAPSPNPGVLAGAGARLLKRMPYRVGDNFGLLVTPNILGMAKQKAVVTKVDAAGVAITYSVDPPVAYLPPTVQRYDAEGRLVGTKNVVSYQPPQQLFPPEQLSPGKFWSNVYTEDIGGTKFGIEQHSRVIGWEEVTVPAGTFRAIKVETIKKTNNRSPADTCHTWLSEEVPLPVKTQCSWSSIVMTAFKRGP